MTPPKDKGPLHGKPHHDGFSDSKPQDADKSLHKPLSLEEKQARRACNTPENAIAAVTTGRTSLSQVKAGRVWTKCAPKGDYEIKGCLLLDGEPVVVLHFSPEDGSLLPKGLHALSAGRPEVSELVEKQLEMIVSEVTVLDGAEFREPEFCWVVPVAHKGRIVAHLRVTADGTSVIADKKAKDEWGG